VTETAFDKVIGKIREAGFHNHRQQDHSDDLSMWILDDLLKSCDALLQDWESHEIFRWLNVRAPGTARGRKMDLMIGPPAKGFKTLQTSKPGQEFRVAIENKSVITAHRNRDARFDDLAQDLGDIHAIRPNAVIIATVLIGVSERVLNVPDRVKPFMDETEFDQKILPRLSTGDPTLWDQFPRAVSENRPDDPRQTVRKFESLPHRAIERPTQKGYDFVALIPVRVDNVNPPTVARDNDLNIDVDKVYADLLATVCRAYQLRWPNERRATGN
jgi:hypothetical protein